MTQGIRKKLGNRGAFTKTKAQLCLTVRNANTLFIAVTEGPTVSNGIGD